MYCPKCGSQNGEDVIYCRGCGVDVASVRTILEASDRSLTASPQLHLSERQLRRMRRRGIDGAETPMTLAARKIELQSGAVRSGLIGGGFAFLTYVVYSRPPVDGIFWLFFAAITFFCFAATVSRFVQASMIGKLLRDTAQPAALPDTQPDYLQPPRSIYETDDLQPRSVTDATTRHLR
ncbi:MAG: zinc ribbon domain-containing protein [Pyrinomonadaceae bacterium]